MFVANPWPRLLNEEPITPIPLGCPRNATDLAGPRRGCGASDSGRLEWAAVSLRLRPPCTQVFLRAQVQKCSWRVVESDSPHRNKRARSPGLPASLSSSSPPGIHHHVETHFSSLPQHPPPFSDTEGEGADERDAVRVVIDAEGNGDEGEGPGVEEYSLFVRCASHNDRLSDYAENELSLTCTPMPI